MLHTHMPYVEGGDEWPPRDEEAHLLSPGGFGTWPFGEQWLWEAIATSYLSLLDVLGDAPLTLSLTPVLCDQLLAPGAIDRCLRFLTQVRPATHALDRRALSGRGDRALIAALEHHRERYARAAGPLDERCRRAGGLAAALGAHAGWTSAATHAVLPLLCTAAGVELQVATGVASAVADRPPDRRSGLGVGGLSIAP